MSNVKMVANSICGLSSAALALGSATLAMITYPDHVDHVLPALPTPLREKITELLPEDQKSLSVPALSLIAAHGFAAAAYLFANSLKTDSDAPRRKYNP